MLTEAAIIRETIGAFVTLPDTIHGSVPFLRTVTRSVPPICAATTATSLVERAAREFMMTSKETARVSLTPFHIAFPVNDLNAARAFYGGVLGCAEGRSCAEWIDFDLFGHQIVAHLQSDAGDALQHNPVDGHAVPIPHFGVVLRMETWEQLADRLKAARTDFIIEPYIRFRGEVGEQATMFFLDPAGNALEFKAFADLGQLFAK